MAHEKGTSTNIQLLNQDQEEVLDMYLQQLDDFYGTLKETEKLQVEIETLHLKRLLTK